MLFLDEANEHLETMWGSWSRKGSPWSVCWTHVLVGENFVDVKGIVHTQSLVIVEDPWSARRRSRRCPYRIVQNGLVRNGELLIEGEVGQASIEPYCVSLTTPSGVFSIGSPR